MVVRHRHADSHLVGHRDGDRTAEARSFEVCIPLHREGDEIQRLIGTDVTNGPRRQMKRLLIIQELVVAEADPNPAADRCGQAEKRQRVDVGREPQGLKRSQRVGGG